jgi:hypothetical protein
MDDAHDLVRLIREKQSQIERLQAELDEARKLLFGNVSGIRRSNLALRPNVVYADPSLKPAPRLTGSVQWTEEVLRDAGKPMHVNDIIASINRRFGVSVQYSTLVGNLSRLVKARKTFDRFGKNVFGLIEWREREGPDGDI